MKLWVQGNVARGGRGMPGVRPPTTATIFPPSSVVKMIIDALQQEEKKLSSRAVEKCSHESNLRYEAA